MHFWVSVILSGGALIILLADVIITRPFVVDLWHNHIMPWVHRSVKRGEARKK